MDLCLGTVQFGMDYGVFDTPKKDAEYCVKCLDYATQNGVLAIDTATAYGTAESVVGSFLAKKTIARDKLFVSTKFLPNILDDCNSKEYRTIITENIKKSLDVLHTDYVDAYFLHSSRYAFQPEILDTLSVVQREGLAKHVGVSVYYPEEALACFENDNVDYIQAPYSIFDHRMAEQDVFEKAGSNNCNVDTRTAFIKGLIRLKIEEVPNYLEGAIPILQKLDKICAETGYSRIELAMGYVKRQNNINHLVFGVRDLEQLRQDIDAFQRQIPSEIWDMIDNEFADVEAEIIIPSLWKK